MEGKYDVLVVGGCSAGLFFAEKMAKQGYKVLVVEKSSEEQLGRRYDIFHLEKTTFERFNLPEPKEGSPELVMTFNRLVSRSALDSHPKTTLNNVFVMHRHEFLSGMKAAAVSANVEIIHNAKFIFPIFDEDGRVSGGNIVHDGKTYEVGARLTVDASGIPSVVRTLLPKGYGVENFEIYEDKKFFVVLYYVKLNNPEKDRVNETCGWPYYKTWIAPQHDRDGAILGVGATFHTIMPKSALKGLKA